MNDDAADAADVMRTAALPVLLAAATAAAGSLSPPRHRHSLPASRARDPARPSVANCTLLYLDQPLDHAEAGSPTWPQRVFVYDGFVTPGDRARAVFFYVGNEADVTLYVNATGWMWERAAEFGALLVWSEHRYYGESQPFGSAEASLANKTYLTVEQAIADHAAAAAQVRARYGVPDAAATVGFGGSYGGMLASWLRMTRPDALDGALAASAPILSFEGERPACDPTFYARGTSYDASAAAGASPACAPALQRAFAGEELAALGASPDGRDKLAAGLRLCGGALGDDDGAGWDVAFWLNDALSYMSMGNYPFASSYILNGDGELPPFPVRVACASFDALDDDGGDDDAWLRALGEFAGVYYNSSGDAPCFELSAPVNPEAAIVNELWNWQYCTQIFQLFGQAGPPNDLLWPSPWDANASAASCEAQYGVPTDVMWATRSFGGDPSAWAASNIVWSNGEYDPWAGGGVAVNDTAHARFAITIAEAAHHLDLMWSDPDDTDAVRAARDFEAAQVRAWIDAKAARAAV